MSKHQNYQKPLALIVFLENIGHIHGLHLPQWVMDLIDFSTEEYAKLLLRLYGAYRRYDKIIILEDKQATGSALVESLLRASQTHRVDVLLLVHGNRGCLIGYKGKELVGAETFQPLLDAYRQNPALLNLRMVYGINCYGSTLTETWLALGAQAVNGALGINWLPEPSLSVFLYNWLKGRRYSQAVQRSNQQANQIWRKILKPDPMGDDHPWLQSSRQIVFGVRDITIDSL
ncbi:MAG: hypothetical protein NT075_04335 [Chloroflexi bacterium]|nr:hypothetical protein [Chloroflexota bacterium]